LALYQNSPVKHRIIRTALFLRLPGGLEAHAGVRSDLVLFQRILRPDPGALSGDAMREE
jgi:hypothetical protein